jgi:aminodeoxyfutalosine deaminase
MAFLTAKQIHNGSGWLPPGSVIEVSDDGTIVSVSDRPQPDPIFYDGVLTPGFVNAHCHLELSHLKGVVPEHTGLIPFLQHIPRHRNDFTDEQKQAARLTAYRQLLDNGIVAVGDIANTTDTLDVRALDQLHCTTFVEAIGFTEVNAPRAFRFAQQTYDAFAAQGPKGKLLRQSIVPHAPYSVSSSLFRLIDEHKAASLISIHNQESREEDSYYVSKTGLVPDLLHSLGIDDSFFSPSGLSSLQSYLPWLSPAHPVILVHNTYSSVHDVRFAHSRMPNAYWCLCPNANLYIENTLPDIDMLISEGANICIGTDSLASNHRLCILSELRSIKDRYSHISWETLISWATGNGAAALQMQHIIGTIEPGKKPGILQLTGLDQPGTLPTVTRIV